MRQILRLLILILLTLIFVTAGFVWGIYDYQVEHNLPNTGVTAIVAKAVDTFKSEATDNENLPESTDERMPYEPDTPITPAIIAPVEPITPTPDTLAREARRAQRLLEKRAQAVIDEGNLFFQTGEAHLLNTYKNDANFDKENDLALKNFMDAQQKYNEAQDIDSNNKWLWQRIRETNLKVVACRKQSRLH